MEGNLQQSTNEDLESKNCCHGNLESWKREFKEIFKLAWPTIIFSLALGSFNIVNIIFCGQLGKKELAAASLGLSFCNVTGVSVAFGFGSAFDTLFSQTYGSENKKYVGIVLQRGLLISGIQCIFIWALYVNVEYILVGFQIDREVARGTATYVHVIMIGVPGLLLFMILQRYLQNQNIVIPVMVLTGLAAVLSVPVHYFFLFVLDLKIIGAALALSSVWWMLAFSFIIYIKIRSLHKQTWAGWSLECLQDWGVIAKLGLAGILMIATEWWVFEIAVFLMGVQGAVEVGAQGSLLQLAFGLAMPALGLLIAVSIRVGNSLGANQPKTARIAALISLISIGIISTVTAVILISLKDFVGKVFTNDVEVLREIRGATPMLALLQLVDPLGVVCMGILQGCGLQKIAAAVVCIIYYALSLPMMFVLVLVYDMSVMGTWIALDTAVCLKAVILLICIWKINWQQQANKAQERAGIVLVSQEENKTTAFLYNGIESEQDEIPESQSEVNANVILHSTDVNVQSDETSETQSELNAMVILHSTDVQSVDTNKGDVIEMNSVKHTLPMHTVIIRRMLTFLFAVLILGASVLVHFIVELPSVSETCISMNGTELLTYDNNTYLCNNTFT